MWENSPPQHNNYSVAVDFRCEELPLAVGDPAPGYVLLFAPSQILSVYYHAIMHLAHDGTSLLFEEKRQKGMDQAHHARHSQIEGERQSVFHVLQVAFFYLLQMCTKTIQPTLPPRRLICPARLDLIDAS